MTPRRIPRRGSVGAVGEFGLIRLIAGWMRTQPRIPGLVKGMGDDCATLLVRGGRAQLKTDAAVEGIHFRREWAAPGDIGWKALCANVSDIAAAGGRPLAALISLELPPATPVAWVKGLYTGFVACARRYRFAIAGGNISSGPHIAIHVSMTGEAPRRLIGRSDARPGDLVAVTGALGGSEAGLAALQRGWRDPAARAEIATHLRPQPNVRAGQVLARHASAMCDISDGLVADAGHVARESKVRLALVPGAIPVPLGAAALATRLGTTSANLAMASGEEYVLLATVPRRCWKLAKAAAEKAGAELVAVGEVRRGRGVAILGPGRPPHGYDHFRRTA